MRLALLAALTALPFAAAHAAPAYHLTATVKLGGETRWDYLTYDPGSQRVFIAQSRQITAVDARTLKVVGHVDGIEGGHGVLVVPGGDGFAASGEDGTVRVFNPITLETIATIHARPQTDALVYDPASAEVFAISGDVNAISVIDPKLLRNVATIETGTGLEFGAADGKGLLFVAAVDARQVLIVNTRTLTVTGHYDVPGCEEPHGLALDKEAGQIFVSCENQKMTVLDAATGKILAEPAIGNGTDAAAYDARRGVAFSANGEGSLSVIDARTLKTLGDLKTSRGARTMAVNPADGTVYLVTAEVTGMGKPDEGGRRRPIYAPGSAVMLVFTPEK